MRIYSMTATFGKLEHQTLTLKPGLNIIEAPNEWGKSTWSAFLVAMLYGIDTRERTKGEHLADKERYAPWSGAAMSGRMDICWNGRDITIERSSKGRSIFGVFRAYETATGLDVPELTAANCGQTLLGVEKSVFLRAGFLRLNDLPVTQDESLRRRLNALVTTGDESGASDILAQKLKNLKNQCKSNSANGLIPKAESQRAELRGKLSRLQQLREQSQRIRQRQEDLSAHMEALENHRAALEYAAAQERAQKSAAAKYHLENAERQVRQLQESCAGLPSPEALLRNLQQLQQLRSQQETAQMDLQMLSAPAPLEVPAMFRGCDPEQAIAQAKQDKAALDTCQTHPPKSHLWILGLVLMLAGVILAFLRQLIPACLCFLPGIVVILIALIRSNRVKKEADRAKAKEALLMERYRPLPPEQWIAAAEQYARSKEEHAHQTAELISQQQDLRGRFEEIQLKLSALTGGLSYLEAEQTWRDALSQHDNLARALREQKQAQALAESFDNDQSLPQPPKQPDTLRFTAHETARLLADAQYEHHQLQLQLGNTQGQMDALGQESDLLQQLEAVESRLARLEETYSALEIAQQTLQDAAKALQRRFAPRISSRAQDLFAKLTGSRYDRLTLGQDLSLSAGAEGEDTLHDSIWRSDGTVDQLYLALRLAVAEELTPNAPLILDDALVRFDDIRLKAALDILSEEAESKQVILFTCQCREAAAMQNDTCRMKEDAL